MNERPGRMELAGVLLACAALLVALSQVDDAVSRRHQERAAAVAAASATPLPDRPTLPAGSSPVSFRQPAPVTIPAAGDVPGRAMALSWLALVGLGGIGMAAVGVRMLRRRSA